MLQLHVETIPSGRGSTVGDFETGVFAVVFTPMEMVGSKLYERKSNGDREAITRLAGKEWAEASEALAVVVWPKARTRWRNSGSSLTSKAADAKNGEGW